MPTFNGSCIMCSFHRTVNGIDGPIDECHHPNTYGWLIIMEKGKTFPSWCKLIPGAL